MIPIKKPLIGDEESAAVMEVLKSGIVAQGPKVAEFEAKFAEKCGASFGVAVNSGTAAAHAIMNAYGIAAGDEVICVSFSFIATATPILMCGATPVFVDIDPATLNIDADVVEAAITDKTKAVVAVNLFGRLAPWAELKEVCDKHGLILLEDAAQSHFASRDGTVSGNFAHAAWFSFYATKNMMMAEGGMVVTNDKAVEESAKRFRQHGMSGLGMYDYEELGYNYRTTDINAAIGLAQLEKIDGFNDKRIAIARRYNVEFAGLPGLSLPLGSNDRDHVYHLYTMAAPNSDVRDAVVAKLKEAGVGCGIYYPTPLSKISVFRDAGGRGECPKAEQASETVFSIPCEPYMSDEQIDEVIATFKECYAAAVESLA